MVDGSSEIDPTCYIHPLGLVEPGARVGARTRIWAFAHVLRGAVIGEDCNVCDHTFIEGGASVGNRVTIKCGVYLWDGVCIADDAFLGPNCTFTNDRYPRSRNPEFKAQSTFVGAGASIGANATVLPGITVGRGALVGSGSVVTKSIPPFAVVAGNPAKVLRFLDQGKRHNDQGA